MMIRRLVLIAAAGVVAIGLSAATHSSQSKAQVVLVPAHVPVENSASADCEGVGASFASFPDGENAITIYAGETGQVVRSFTGPSGSVSATWAELEQTEAVEGGSTILYYFEWTADGGGRYPETGSFVFYPDCSDGSTTTTEEATTTTLGATTTTVGATTTTVGATTTVVQPTTTLAQVTTTVVQPTTTPVVTTPPTTAAQPTTTVVATTVPVVQPTTTAVAVATTLPPPPPTTPPALPPTGGTNTLLKWGALLVGFGLGVRFVVRRLA